MHSFRFLVAVCHLTVLMLDARGVEIVTPQSIPQRVRTHNPGLAAARLTIDEAIGRMHQAGRLENPELQVGPSYNTASAERGIEVTLRQQFPVTDRLRLEKDLGAREVESARQEIREVENRLIGDANAAMVRLLAARQRRALLDQQMALARALADHLAALAQRGEASALDAGQARLEASRLTSESRRRAVDEQQAMGALKPLIGIKPGEAVSVVGALPGVASPAAVASSARPALEVARLAVLGAQQNAQLERSKRTGDLTAGFVAAVDRNLDEPSGARNEGWVGLQLSIPLPFWDRRAGQIEAADARAERMRREVVALERQFALEAETARAEMHEWGRLVADIDTTLLPQADAQLGQVEQAWRLGQTDLANVMRSREQRLNLAVSRLEALEQHHLARVRHATAIGHP